MTLHMTVGSEDFTVEYIEELEETLALERPPFITFDTETTGLHIKGDRPTLGAVCIDHKVFVFPMNKKNCHVLRMWAGRVRRVYGHNVIFDMHMVANCMEDDSFPLSIKNWGDTMGLCRLAFEAVSVRDGGDSLKLKRVGKKYIDPESGQYEEELKDWMKKKASADNKILTAFLKPHKWSYSKLVKAIKDGEIIPQEVTDIYREWRMQYPRPTYADVPMDVMLPYVACDVILTQLVVYKTLPEIVATQVVPTMEREFKVLPVVYKMERSGIKVDRDYLLQSQVKLETYIDKLYGELHKATGIEFSVSQNKVIKQMYQDMLGDEEEVTTTDKKFLKKMEARGDKAAALITRIRRFEKWLATYIIRVLKVSEYDGRFYTSLNQFNPVSGRFSGDAQQFPKEPIYTEEGYEWEKTNKGHKVPEEYVLYHPRRSFVGNMFYIDYSQVELRVQAHYTMAFGGDTNLCRAYMPFGCVHGVSGELYDHTTVEGRAKWSELRSDAPAGLHWEDALEKGWSVWVNPDTQGPWIPTDVHSATTTKALVAMGYEPETMSKDDFKYWRAKGKTFNFMRNYGGGDGMAAKTLDIPIEAARAMNRGYTDSFPLVVTYQNNVVRRMRERGYCVNMYGRRYYVSNWNKHYKVANYLIQGSCADMLKEKMILIDQFLQDKQLKTRMVLCVHDELQFEVPQGEEWAIPHIKGIMEDTPHVAVPIVAEVEYTSSAWSEKKKWSHAS